MLKAHEEVERVARLLWEEDSLSQVYRFNHAAGRVDVTPEVRAFLERTYAYYQVSNGAFDALTRYFRTMHKDTIDAYEAANPGADVSRISAAIWCQTHGEPFEYLGCDLWEFRDGYVTKKDTYWKFVG